MKKALRVFDLLYQQLEFFPLTKCMGSKIEDKWVFKSTAEVLNEAEQLASGLLHHGFSPGDKIALVSYKNIPEWTITDLALQMAGMISIPLYPTISPAEYAYILKESEAVACFVGPGDLKEKILQAQDAQTQLPTIFAWEKGNGAYWKDLFQPPSDAMYSIRDRILEEDLFTIIYTSGTTGEPKGVMLNHLNVLSSTREVQHIIPVNKGDRVLSFLPLCHIFERAASFAYLAMGLKIAYTGTDNLGGDSGDLKMVRPHFFTCVPRLLEKVYDKIYLKGLELSGFRKSLFFWALRLTDNFSYGYKAKGFESLKWKIADKLIFTKWREALGGEVKGIITGAAPCPEKIARVFSAAGIPVREGYGLTESSPGISINRFEPDGCLLGTVGPVLESVELRLIMEEAVYEPDEGEIVISGPNVMMGYYKKPEVTAEVLKSFEGKTWLYTGDVGRLVKGSKNQDFLKITDRKKELLKTSGGKYVAPAPIEAKFKEEFLIENLMVVGDGYKFVSALIVPEREGLIKWCKLHGIEKNQFSEYLNSPKVLSKFQSILDKINPNFSHIEQIKKFTLVSSSWELSKTWCLLLGRWFGK